MPITLNQGQKACADGFFEFLLQSDQKEFSISGPGGVGKTALMGYMIDEIMPRYHAMCNMMGIKSEFDEVYMTATTNKAAEVLGVASGRPTSTIHSLMNLKVQDDYKTGESKLAKTRNWTVHQRKIVFIDEGSMIDTPLYDVIHEGTHKSKIVYVGDHCQLAPIKEPISPIYRKDIPFFELTEQMRTNNPDLMAVNEQLRNTVKTGEFYPIKIVPGVIDWLDNDQMQAQIKAHFTEQTHDSRILAYTNNRVMEFNDYVRQIRHLPDHFTTGEFLVNNSAIQLKQRMLSVEEGVEVLFVNPVVRSHEIDDDTYLDVWEVTIETKFGEQLEVHLPVDRSHFAALLKHYSKTKQWHLYYKLKNTYPDLRPRDAATVHKAQGSTYDSVFIDVGNLSTCHNPNQVARMLYVAFTRARSRVFLFGNLAQKYGGLIQ